LSDKPAIRLESGSLGYSAHLKRSVSESAVLQQSAVPRYFDCHIDVA
jgi:hypothetical protein